MLYGEVELPHSDVFRKSVEGCEKGTALISAGARGACWACKKECLVACMT